ncbi:TIGR04283 family arsenosugar biosynthesis glycosyltransferase [Kaarinaea lacus]
MPPQALSLSVIIPALNEAENLPRLLHDLSAQDAIQFETIVVDGGSTDDTRTLCENFTARQSIGLQVRSSPSGRGIQMNHGSKIASADDYLFLHADTRIQDPLLLFNAQQTINDARQQSSHNHIAGHFPLRFISQGSDHKYYFYECKTYLNRPDTINGDQGFWIAREYFESLGGFDGSLPYMEDARLALKIFATGQWITLPGKIETSARRFETEGFTKRQILNSFLCNFNHMGVNEFFASAIDAYRKQDKATKLQLRPFLKLAHQQICVNGFRIALRRWYQTGAYVASNAWQLAFALDCKRAKNQGLAPGTLQPRSLEFYDRHIARVTNWPIIKFITALFTIIWFYSLFLIR